MKTPSVSASPSHLPRRGGGGTKIGCVLDDVAEGGEGLGLEFVVHRVAAGGVDVVDVGEGALVVLGRCDGVEFVEGKVVDLADGDWGEGGV